MLLKDLAYYKTGGKCDKIHFPTNTDELSATVKELHRSGTPFFLLGGGTNSLVMDDHYRGAVICFNSMNRAKVSNEKLSCQAGCENIEITKLSASHGLEGVAWMHRLPGQIGGTVRMNARCYGGEISQVVKKITTVSRKGEIIHYEGNTSVFRGYKDTVFMANGDIISEVTMQLKKGDKTAIMQQMDFCEKDREGKGQFKYPTCGCVFKNDYRPDVSVPSGLLLQEANVYALNSPTVEVNPLHANFVYNKGASSREILEFTLKMRELVYQTYGVWLEYEMEILGSVPPDLIAALTEQRPSSPKAAKISPLRQKFLAKTKPSGV
ncbi:MAG: UDP-N-acetylmuramate dehydrogenase [Oligoflexales bacterium]